MAALLIMINTTLTCTIDLTFSAANAVAKSPLYPRNITLHRIESRYIYTFWIMNGTSSP